MKHIVKVIPATNGELHVISAGQRRLLAHFNGRIEIIEDTKLVPILGTIQKGTKTIYASFIVCGDLKYHCQIDNDFIHAGKVYEASADVESRKIDFAGLHFEDSNPLNNELIFSISDLELIQQLLK